MIFPTAGECVNCGHRDHMVYVTAGQPAEYLGCLADGCQCQDYVAAQEARRSDPLCATEGCSAGDCAVCRELHNLRTRLADAQEWREVYEPDVRLWQLMYAHACSDVSDTKLGQFVREWAVEYFYGEKPRMEAIVAAAEVAR